MEPDARRGAGALLAAPAVVPLAAEIDIGNADEAGGQLHAAPAVLRILHVLGIASVLRIYPSLSAALAPAPAPGK